MAREGIDYFPLNCQLDEKFELIEAQFGLKGFAIVVKLLQRIYREHGYYCEWSDDITFLFARQNGLSNSEGNNLIADVVTASIRRGIFDETLFKTYGILTSRGIQKRYLDVVYKRKEVVLKKEYLLLSDGNLKENVTISNDSDDRKGENDDISKQSKGKERKEEKRKEEESKGKKKSACDVFFPNDEKLNQTFLDFIDMRKKLKNGAMTEQAVTRMVGKIARIDNDTAIAMLDQSIVNNWKDIYPIKAAADKNPGQTGKAQMDNESLRRWAGYE